MQVCEFIENLLQINTKLSFVIEFSIQYVMWVCVWVYDWVLRSINSLEMFANLLLPPPHASLKIYIKFTIIPSMCDAAAATYAFMQTRSKICFNAVLHCFLSIAHAMPCYALFYFSSFSHVPCYPIFNRRLTDLYVYIIKLVSFACLHDKLFN